MKYLVRSALAFLFATAVFVPPAQAQEAEANCGAAPCPLRVQGGGLTISLVRGRDPGTVVSERLFFLPVDLTGAVESPPGDPRTLVASRFAQDYERSQWLAAASTALGGVLLYVALSPDGLASQDVRIGAGVGTVAFAVIGTALQSRAVRSRTRALDAYNSGL